MDGDKCLLAPGQFFLRLQYAGGRQDLCLFVCMSKSEIIDVCLCTVPIPIPLERGCLLKWLIYNKVYDCLSFCLVHLKIFFFLRSVCFYLEEISTQSTKFSTFFFFNM